MNLLAIILGWTVSSACIVAVIACAALGSILWAFISAAVFIFITSRTLRLCGERETDRQWEDASRHPRI